MKVIGLTGNIGSGKSTVGRMLADLGASVIDCDMVSRQLTAPGMPCLQQIIKNWGSDYLLSDGSLDRKKMAANIFSYPDKKKKLEQILHPAIIEEVQRQIEANRSRGADCVVLEAPLLIEAGLTDLVDTIWLVMSKREDVLDRLETQRGYTRQAAQAALDSQMPDVKKLPYADVVIQNSGGIEELKETVIEMWQNIHMEK